jgi:hypothetical protein
VIYDQDVKEVCKEMWNLRSCMCVEDAADSTDQAAVRMGKHDEADVGILPWFKHTSELQIFITGKRSAVGD